MAKSPFGNRSPTIFPPVTRGRDLGRIVGEDHGVDVVLEHLYLAVGLHPAHLRHRSNVAHRVDHAAGDVAVPADTNELRRSDARAGQVQQHRVRPRSQVDGGVLIPQNIDHAQ